MKREQQGYIFRITPGVAAQLLLGSVMMLGILFSAGLVTGLGWAGSPGLGGRLSAALAGGEAGLAGAASQEPTAPAGAEGAATGIPAGLPGTEGGLLPADPRTVLPAPAGLQPGAPAAATDLAPAGRRSSDAGLLAGDHNAPPLLDRLTNGGMALASGYVSQSYVPLPGARGRFDGLDAILAELTGAAVSEPRTLAANVRTADPTGTANVRP